MRNITLDIMKGIGIILVVLYHAMGINNPSYLTDLNNGLFNMIACFFMQLFMVVSGYLVYEHAVDFNWLKTKFVQWIIPILSFLLIYYGWWCLLPSLIKMYDLPFLRYLSYTLLTGFTGLVTWYLWCLLLCYLVAVVIYKLHTRYPKLNMGLLVLVVILFINIIPADLLGMIYLKWYGTFFLIGYLIKYYSETKLIKIGSKLSYLCIILFPLLGYLFNWLNPPFQNTTYGYIGMSVMLPAIMNGSYWLVGLMILMALLGIGFVYAIAKWIKHWNIFIQIVFSYLGRISVGIFLLHVMFVGIVHNYWLATLISLIISIVLYDILRRIKYVNRVLFGVI